MVDPKVGVLGNCVGGGTTAAATGLIVRKEVVGQQSEGVGLVTVGLVKGQPKQGSGGVPLRRRQIRRRRHNSLSVLIWG